MDIETKEAVLKLAGYVVEANRLCGRGGSFMYYQVVSDNNSLPIPIELLSQAVTREAAINVAYNVFLTRQNETTES